VYVCVLASRRLIVLFALTWLCIILYFVASTTRVYLNCLNFRMGKPVALMSSEILITNINMLGSILRAGARIFGFFIWNVIPLFLPYFKCEDLFVLITNILFSRNSNSFKNCFPSQYMILFELFLDTKVYLWICAYVKTFWQSSQ